MHLCEVYRYEPGKLKGYSVQDTKGMFNKHGRNNVDVSWSDFRQALIQYTMKQPPEKPSMFHGEWYPPQHTIDMRKRLLAAILRDHVSPESLAEDLLEWRWRGRDEDIRKFIITLLHGVSWRRDPPKTSEAATTKVVEKPPEGQILLMG